VQRIEIFTAEFKAAALLLQLRLSSSVLNVKLYSGVESSSLTAAAETVQQRFKINSLTSAVLSVQKMYYCKCAVSRPIIEL